MIPALRAGALMKRFIEGQDRSQTSLFPECIDDYVEEDNPVRAVDAFVDMLDLAALDFNVEPEATGRPGYHPATMLRLHLYGYLNQVQSSRKLERECGRNLELIWLLGRLKPDFKTIADFRRDNGPAIRSVCRQFIALCRNIGLLDSSLVAIDGSKFKAVNAKAKSYTHAPRRWAAHERHRRDTGVSDGPGLSRHGDDEQATPCGRL
jgi:transposase